MFPFPYHVFVCDQKKPDGAPSCPSHGSQAVLDALRREVGQRDLGGSVMVTSCGSLGQCESGPNLVVYPAGVWYSGVTVADVPEIVSSHFQAGNPVERLMRRDQAALKKEVAENRSRMLAGLKARDAAGVLPEDLAETIRAYMPSRILLTAIELDVFTAVARAGAPSTADAIASSLRTDRRATGSLLNALVSLGVMTKSGDSYANAPQATRFLVAGAPDDATTALRHNLSLWRTWSTLTDVVRQGGPVHHVDMNVRGDDWTAPFIAAMHKNASLRAPALVKAVGADGVRRLIDIGGGSGAYSIAFAQASKSLRADVFDLDSVVPLAARYLAEAGVGDRVSTRIGDLRRDPFGANYDVALISAICHMLDPEENRDLLKRARSCLVPGGRVVIQDHVMNVDKTLPRAGAIFAINMLVGTPGGSTYSEAEYTSWLQEAGFKEITRVGLQGPTDLMIGRK
jgi:(2Fe-2S) ferredoxin/SAM-dependent methyltransferase